MPYKKLFSIMLFSNEFEPKIKYLLKLFSIKKSEEISIIFDS